MKNHEIDEIKNRIKINELISRYIKVNKAGSGFNALCPFHNEKTPSFSISPQRGIYKCFGCGKSGDIFTFVQEYENINFQQALEKLASQSGVILSNYKKKTPEQIIQKKKEDLEKEKLLTLLKDATRFFQINLFQNQEAKDYLKKRGVKEKIVKKFKLGYAKKNWNELKDYLQKKGYTDQQILEVGLIKKNEDKKSVYDRFRSRIIFPIFNQQGDIIAYSGRDLTNNNKVAKYLNSPSTLFFDKSDTLYGFYQAKVEARKRGYFILVEGQMDLIMSHQAGFENTVATSGTSLTKNHLENMSYFSKKIIFAFDSDNAGVEAAFRGIKIALKKDFDVKILNIQKGKDPADIILEDEREWKKIVLESKNFIDFYISKILTTKISLKDKVKQMEEKILPFIAQIDNIIEKGRYITKISKGFDVKEDFIQEAILEIKKKEEENNNYTKKKQKDFNNNKYIKNNIDIFSKNNIINQSKKKIINQLLSIYFWQENLGKESFIKFKNIFLFLEKNIKKDHFNKIIQLKKREKKDLIFRAEKEYIGTEVNAIKNDIDFLQKRFFEITKKEKISYLQKKIFTEDSVNKKSILKEINSINKQQYGEQKQ